MIEWKNASLRFGNKEVIKNLNFKVSLGEKFILNRESGSGKTTLLKTALGIFPLDSGEIHINGTSLNFNNINTIRGMIFYLDQDVSLPEMPINQFFSELYEYKANKTSHLNNKKLEELLFEFRLDSTFLNKNIKELSGGERQRIGLVTGLMLDRPIWLLDEPTSALDKELKLLVVNKIKQSQYSAIVVSHDDCWNNL
ncbi:MAG: ATP-binding cassette domain-containing protein [Spirochaetales bacterium]|nr:ATP-binding cassette domain-containing protein [Spirochaetales bacterium]